VTPLASSDWFLFARPGEWASCYVLCRDAGVVAEPVNDARTAGAPVIDQTPHPGSPIRRRGGAAKRCAFPKVCQRRKSLVGECLNPEFGEVKQRVWKPVAATSSSTSNVHSLTMSGACPTPRRPLAIDVGRRHVAT
jgi:hypothetical protein